MLDRIPSPGKEGRMLITPEDGSAPFYARVTMADEPLQEGTLLAKRNLLSDDVAAHFGGDQSFVPNDALRFLGERNLHWWRRTVVNYSENRQDMSALTLFTNGSSNYGTVVYSDSIVFNELTGIAELVNPTLISISSTDYSAFTENCLGKYICTSYSPTTWFPQVYYIPEDVTFKSGGDHVTAYYVEVYGAKMVLTHKEDDVSYVFSESGDTYPINGQVDGAQYSYIGIPLENAEQAPRMELLTYIASGTFTEDAPYALSASFAPDLWIMIGKATFSVITKVYAFVAETGATRIAVSSLMNTEYTDQFWGMKTKLSEDGKTIYFPMSSDDAAVVYVLAIKGSSPMDGQRPGAGKEA